MRRALAGYGLVALVAECIEIEAGPQLLARAHQHRTQREMQLVDEPRLQVFAHRGNAAADAHVLAAGGLARLLERRLDAVGDEMEGGAPKSVASGKSVDLGGR